MVLNTIYPSEEDTSANFRDELTSDEESSIGDSAIESSGALDNRAAMAVGNRMPARITQSHLSRLLAGVRALSWTVYPGDLAKLLDEAVRLVRCDADVRLGRGDAVGPSRPLSQGERTQLGLLMQEAVPFCFLKCLTDNAVHNWPLNVQQDIFEACASLGRVTIASAERYMEMANLQVTNPDQTGDWDDVEEQEEVVIVLTALREAFSWRNEWAEKNKDKTGKPGHTTAPALTNVQARLETAACSPQPVALMERTGAPEGYDEPVQLILQEPCYLWQAYLVDDFVATGGIGALEGLLTTQRTPSVALLEAALGVAAAAMDFLLPDRCRVVMNWLSTFLLATLDQRLKDSVPEASERNGSGATSSLFGHLYSIIDNAPAAEEGTSQPCASDVAHVQRNFIELLVQKGLFARQLSALREVDSMLRHVEALKGDEHDQLLQSTISWLRESKVLEGLLRANLHQRQYADLVARVLSRLAASGGVSNDELSLLWNIAQKADTFEAVRVNVYSLLGTLAMALGPGQLDVLFSFFESGGASGAAGDSYLMELLQKLIDSDTQGATLPKLAERLPELLWHLTFPAAAPSGSNGETVEHQAAISVVPQSPKMATEPSGLQAMAPAMRLLCQAVMAYDLALPNARIEHKYAVRCVNTIAGAPGSGNQAFAALQLLQLFAANHLHTQPRLERGTWAEVVRQLEAKQRLAEVVSEALQRFQAAECLRLQHQPHSPPQEALVAQAQHAAAIEAFTSFLRSRTVWLHQTMERELVQRLWSALCVSPPYPSDRDVFLRLLGTKGAVELLTGEVARELLEEQLPQLAATTASSTLVETQIHLMTKVNQENGKLVLDPTNNTWLTSDTDLVGMQYLWRLALEAPVRVHEKARDQLIKFHQHLAPPLSDDPISVHRSFLREGVRELLHAAEVGSSPECSEEARSIAGWRTALCLEILNRFLKTCEGRAQPPQPAHGASFVGDQVLLLVDCQGPPRRTLASHGNCYLGTLRKQLAELMGPSVDPAKLRLISGGKDYVSNSMVLRDVAFGNDTIHFQVSLRPATWTGDAALSNTSDTLSQFLASQAKLPETLAALAQSAPLPESRMGAVRLAEQLPTRAPEAVAVRFALLEAADASAALTAALSPPSPSHLLYMLQAVAALVQPANSSLTPEEITTARAALKQPAVMQALIEAVASVEADPHNAVTLSKIGLLAVSLLQLQLPAAPPQTPQQSGSGSATSMSMDTAAAVTATAETPTSGALAGLAPASTSQPSSQPARKARLRAKKAAAAPVASAVELAVARAAEAPPQLGATAPGRPAAAEPAGSESPAVVAAHNAASVEEVLQLAVRYVAQLIVAACAGWRQEPLPVPMVGEGEVLSEEDVKLAHSGLAALGGWVTARPALAMSCLNLPGVSEALMDALLCADKAQPKAAAQEVLTQVAARVPRGRAWLLRTLAASEERANTLPAHCEAYYQVAVRVAQDLSSSDPEEVVAGQAAMRHLLAAVPGMARDSDGDCRLQGQLRLLAALYVSLDGQDAVESPGPAGPSLTSTLITDFLFPEVAPVMDTAAAAAAACQPRCTTDLSRKAGLDLLQVQMSHDAEALQEGAGLLTHSQIDKLNLQWWNYSSFHDTRGPSGYVGLVNLGATCYANSVFQQLFMQPAIRHLILGGPEDSADAARAPSVFGQLQLIFGHLAAGQEDAFNPVPFFKTYRDFDGSQLNVREHQDADEFFTRLQDVVDTHLQAVAGRAALQPVMGGKFAQQIICPSVPYRSEKEDEFCRLQVDVRGKANLEASLEAYVQGELMEGDNQYHCDQINAKVDAVKRNCIKVLPHMLVVHLKRFEFDYETMTRWKIKDRFAFPLQIDMAPYTADGLAVADAAEQAEKDGSLAPPPAEQQMYQLKGVVVHSGTAFAGHYYSYIQDREDGKWHVYDDISVDPWDVANLDKDCFGGRFVSETNNKEYDRPNSAFMLFYERIGGSDVLAAITSAAQPAAPAEAPAAMDATPAGVHNGSAPRADTSATSPALKEQQQQLAAGAVAAIEAAAPGDPSTQAALRAAVASEGLALPAGEPMDATASPVADTEARSSNGSVQPEANAKAADPGRSERPYGMPPGVWSEVVASNLTLLREQHCLTAPYFKFIQAVVASWCERGIGSSTSSKMRRMGGEVGAGSDPPPPRPPAAERRPEDSETAVATAAKLGLSFLLKVYCRVNLQAIWPDLSGTAISESLSEWRATLSKLVASRRIAWEVLCEFLHEAYLGSHLQNATPADLKAAVLGIFGEACRSVFSPGPLDPTEEVKLDRLAVQLVWQMYEHQAGLVPALGPQDQQKERMDPCACFDAYAAVLEHNHPARKLLLDVHEPGHNVLVCLLNDMLPRANAGKLANSQKISPMIRSMLNLTCILLLSTEGPPQDGTAAPNPAIRVPAGKQPYPWPASVLSETAVTTIINWVHHELTLTQRRTQLIAAPRFFRLVAMLTFNNGNTSVPALNQALQFLARDRAPCIEAAQAAFVEMFAMQDTLAAHRINFLLQPPGDDSRNQQGMMQQIADLLKKINSEASIAFAMVRIVVAIADAHPPATTQQVSSVLSSQPSPTEVEGWLWAMDQLRRTKTLALHNWNATIAESYPWANDPNTSSLLDRASELCIVEAVQPDE